MTLNALPFLDAQRFVAFGRVVEGLRTLNLINKVQTAFNERPLVEVRVLDCGKYKVSKKGRLHSLHPRKAEKILSKQHKQKLKQEEEASDENNL